jgi:pSer/pThr/pTyr-binding forkhead associated (FHA) protein
MRLRTTSRRPSTRYEAPFAHELSSTLDLHATEAAHAETIVEVPRTTREEHGSSEAPKRRLIPLDHEGESILLLREIMTIGRTKDNDICIPSRAISRDHARVVMSSRSVTVFDMQSANGCFVNDERVKRHKLREGDVLRIGDRSFRFASGA